MLSAGISEPWDRRSSLRSSNLSSVLVLTTSGVPLWEWSVVWPSSPSDTDRFSELNVDTDWHLVMLVGLLGRGTVTSLNYRTDSTEDWRRLEIILVFLTQKLDGKEKWLEGIFEIDKRRQVTHRLLGNSTSLSTSPSSSSDDTPRLCSQKRKTHIQSALRRVHRSTNTRTVPVTVPVYVW